MAAFCKALCRLLWGAFLLLTSVYCLLAYLPYTYVALVKAPPYLWMLRFIGHYAALYWIAAALSLFAFLPLRKHRLKLLLMCAELVVAFFLPHFMAHLSSDNGAYVWSLIALALLIALTSAEAFATEYRAPASGDSAPAQVDYSTGAFVAALVAVVAAAGAMYSFRQAGAIHLRIGQIELVGWSLLSHVLVAIAVLSLLNLIALAAARVPRPHLVHRLLIALLAFAGLWFAIVGFLESALSFAGWRAHLYAASLAAALALLVYSIAAPYFSKHSEVRFAPRARKTAVAAMAVILIASALALPSLIGGADWNGFLQSTFAIAFWLALTACAYALRPSRVRYSWVTILAVLIFSGVAYKSLQATEIFWGKALGSTDDDIARAQEAYAAQDASFSLAYRLLGNSHAEGCGDLCRILREYTNIRDARVPASIDLVDPLISSAPPHPNIFLFVIDSLRPDYLGAYDPKVDFSPHLDAFARDSLVIHNVYTQYAGTSLSEPAIWAGMLLLHAHYMQPFSRVNSLEKLAAADDYQLMVSNDEVLSQLLSPSDHAIKLDSNLPLWNQLEVCSTIRQAEQALDARGPSASPVLFYTQPKNVHQFAHNNLPRMTDENWRARPGFVNRIAYEVHQVDGCIGSFFDYLKTRGLYDNSIIILTSDHGDATGEFGRSSHSLSIYPEVMRVPLIIHLPPAMRGLAYDDQRVSALTDITPTLYYLLGHRPVAANPMFGRPLLMQDETELHSYHRDELFLASDERAVYGILADHGRYLYATYDSPAQSYLYDLAADPNGLHSILTPALKQQYDERIIQHLQAIADFYGYRPRFWTVVASSAH